MPISTIPQLRAAHPTKAVGENGWYLVAIVVLAQLLSYIDRGVLSLFGHSIAESLKLSDTQLSYLYGFAFIIPLAVCSLFIGWAVDRCNRVVIIFLGLVLWSAMTALFGVVTSFWCLLLARGGIGVGEAALAPAAYAMIGDRFSPSERGRAVGVVAASVSIGAGGALIVGGALLGVMGPLDRSVGWLGVLHPWQLSFVILGLSGVPVGLLVLTLRDGRLVRGASGTRLSTLSDIRRYLHAHVLTFSAIFFAGSINVAVGTGVMAWAPTLLLRRFQLPASRAGLLLGLATLAGGLLGPPIATELSDRRIGRGEKAGRFHNYPYLFLILLFGVVALGTAASVTVFLVAVILVAAALGGINALSYAATQDLSPPQIRGRMIAMLQFTTLAFGYGLGPSLVAFVTDRVFKDRQMVSQSILAVAIPLCVAALVLVVSARRSYQRTQESIDRNEAVHIIIPNP